MIITELGWSAEDWLTGLLPSITFQLISFPPLPQPGEEERGYGHMVNGQDIDMDVDRGCSCAVQIRRTKGSKHAT